MDCLLFEQTNFDVENNQSIKTLGIREQYRDEQWLKRDPICKDRLIWRAGTFRHLAHLIPGQTILELGAGHGLFTRQLLRITRGENPITSVTFASNQTPRENSSKAVEFINCSSLPGELAGRQFDFVIALDLLRQAQLCLVSPKSLRIAEARRRGYFLREQSMERRS